MAKRVSVDRWMFTVTTILVFIGLVMIFSASAVMAKERYGSAYEFLLKQLVWAVAGLVVMVVATKVDSKRLQHPAPGQNHWLATVRSAITSFEAAAPRNRSKTGRTRCRSFRWCSGSAW